MGAARVIEECTVCWQGCLCCCVCLFRECMPFWWIHVPLKRKWEKKRDRYTIILEPRVKRILLCALKTRQFCTYSENFNCFCFFFSPFYPLTCNYFQRADWKMKLRRNEKDMLNIHVAISQMMKFACGGGGRVKRTSSPSLQLWDTVL